MKKLIAVLIGIFGLATIIFAVHRHKAKKNQNDVDFDFRYRDDPEFDDDDDIDEQDDGEDKVETGYDEDVDDENTVSTPRSVLEIFNGVFSYDQIQTMGITQMEKYVGERISKHPESLDGEMVMTVSNVAEHLFAILTICQEIRDNAIEATQSNLPMDYDAHSLNIGKIDMYVSQAAIICLEADKQINDRCHSLLQAFRSDYDKIVAIANEPLKMNPEADQVPTMKAKTGEDK